MNRMGFHTRWVKWIMSCVTSVHYSVLINGTPEGQIIPQRGLRQGDPLSPYLFILCAEVLSHLMTRAMNDRSLLGVKIALGAPAVNHLLFADDSLFFSLANPKAGRKLKQILGLYEAVSGQSVNLGKSSITFGSKVSEDVKRRMRNLLGIHNEGGHGKYLGLPEQFGRKKSDMFRYIIDRVKAATQGWNKKFLSHGGKEVLLKSIALAMPIYSMNVFRLPKNICEEINSLLAKFWWSSGEKKGMHWYSWDRLSIPKREGGLGFRDLEKFNQALLSKQVWRILQQPNSLVARLLKARYYPDGNILSAVGKTKASYAWKSLIFGRDLLKQGMRFIIGNGSTVSMWSDPWLPTHPPRAPRAIIGMEEIESVENYIKTDGMGWNMDKLMEKVIPEDIEIIRKLKISSKAELDLLGWHYTDDGIYSVKSGYWLSTHLPDNNPIQPTWGEPLLKKKIWKCSSPPKIMHFLWKTLSRSLAVGSNLRRRHITMYDQCMRCCSAPETEQHLLFDCPYAQRIWRASGIGLPILLDPNASLETKIEVCIQSNMHPSLVHIKDLPISILWRLWKSRNALVFQQKDLQWWVVLKQARSDAQEWSQYNQPQQESSNCRPSTLGAVSNVWRKPAEGWLKCNVDGSFVNSGISARGGWVVRDSNGTFITAGHAEGKIVNSALEAEFQALLMAIQFCWCQGYTRVIFEGDNKKMIDILQSKVLQFGLYNWVREIRWWLKKIGEVDLLWTRRHNNMVADRLAKAYLPANISFQSYCYVPRFVTHH